MKASVINNTNYDINIKLYKKFLTIALKVSSIKGDVCLLFTDNEYIRTLNKNFRQKDKATDVLTFSFDDGLNGGDIAISYEWVIKNYSKEKYKKNIYKLIVHSILHLKGIHHNYSKASLIKNRKKMNSLYKKIKTYIKIKKHKIYGE